jgi:DNA/RNA-binding protein KIN17
MPKAEVGSTKYLNNKLKSKGLQRLRWYCQVCERQMRDENGFKCHVASESHVRQMLVVGENSAKFINDYSGQFQRDFLQLLRTSHGEKKVNLNHFYQEYIHNKEHVHMNATRWPSLTEFGKFLGREGICRVEEGDKGLEVGWIDNSPEALRRQDAIRKKERQDKGDEEREQKLIAEQINRARRDAESKPENEGGEAIRNLQREEGEKITLNFGSKPTTMPLKQMPSPPTSSGKSVSPPATGDSAEALVSNVTEIQPPAPVAIKIAMSKAKNVFGSNSKKNAFGGIKSGSKIVAQKPMSEAERIMKEEIERKRARDNGSPGGQPQKRMRL